MKGWLLIKNNIFFCVFLVAHILMVGLAINGQTHVKDININKAIFYHFIMTFLFGLGYLLPINLIKDKKNTTAVQYLTLDKTFFYLAFALTTFGLFSKFSCQISISLSLLYFQSKIEPSMSAIALTISIQD